MVILRNLVRVVFGTQRVTNEGVYVDICGAKGALSTESA